jgi:NAD(P)-dependent dehydrogenase (short-subunit alcohol dehydrogenase family)
VFWSRSDVEAGSFVCSQPVSVPVFLRSLSTALSLRFPLHTPGDPFRPSYQMPSLAAVINGLPLLSPPSSLAPLEAQPIPKFADAFNRRVLTSIGVVQGCLPLLRQSREGDGVVVTLISSATGRVFLPFRAIECASDAALVAAMDSLRREVLLSENVKGCVRIVNLDVGFFHLPSTSVKQQPQQMEMELPGHLRGIYSPALERRLVASSDRGCVRNGRRKSDTSKLSKKVFNIIVKGRGGRRTHVGAGGAFF